MIAGAAAKIDESNESKMKTLLSPRPPFGDPLDHFKITNHALRLCQSLLLPVVLSDQCKESDSMVDGKACFNTMDEQSETPASELRKKLRTRRNIKKRSVFLEYNASSIPNHIGSQMSIDEMVRFVNGNNNPKDEMSNYTYGIRTRQGNMKKLKRKPKSKFNQTNNLKIAIEYSAIGNGDLLINDDTVNTDQFMKWKHFNFKKSYDDSVETEDDESYQIVRRKQRHRKNFSKSCSDNNNSKQLDNDYYKRNISYSNGFSQGRKKSNLFNNNAYLNIDDKQSMILFIHQLWMDFDKQRRLYTKDYIDSK